MLYCHKKCIGWHKKWLYSNDKTKNVYCSSNGILILFRHTRQKYVLFSFWLFFVLLFFMIFVIQTSQITSFGITRSVGHPQNYSECILNRSKHIVVNFGVNGFIPTYSAIVMLHCVYGGSNKYLLILFNQ